MATGRIGTTPVLQVRWSKAPSAGTTSLSGLDDNSVSLVYSVGYEAVYRNGVLLSRTNDYTATDGTTVTLIDATIAGDIIEIFANQLVPLTDAISKGQFTAKAALLSATAASTPAVLTVGANDTVLTADSSTATGLKWAAPAGSSGPTFRAYKGSVQNPSANTLTKIVFDTESWDTDNCFDPTTNYRFTPNKAGYYMVNLALTMTADPLNKPNVSIIYKNGAQYENLYIGAPMVTTSECLASAATIINFNGTTDYIEAYYYSEAGTSRSIVQGSINTHFSAVWIRS